MSCRRFVLRIPKDAEKALPLIWRGDYLQDPIIAFYHNQRPARVRRRSWQNPYPRVSARLENHQKYRRASFRCRKLRHEFSLSRIRRKFPDIRTPSHDRSTSNNSPRLSGTDVDEKKGLGNSENLESVFYIVQDRHQK